MAPAAGGIRAVTLGAWIAIVDQHGWDDERIWMLVDEAARAALSAVRRTLRPGEDDELVSDVVALAREFPTSWRHPARAGALLASWFGGVMKKLLRTRRRRGSRTAGDRDKDVVDPRSVRRRGQDEADAAAAARVSELRQLVEERQANLTPLQREAVDLHLQRLSHGAAARRLGIERDTFRDRLRRAVLRLRSDVPAPVRHDRGRVAALAEAVADAGDARGAALLALRAAGRTFRACAEALGRTLAAVRSHAARLWRSVDLSPDTAPRDTHLPPRTLPFEKGASPFPERGVDDGRASDSVAPRGRLHAAADRGGRDPP